MKLPRYSIACRTVNLGANSRRSGHPTFKHCFAKMMDDSGKITDTFAYGRNGLTHEPYPDVQSAKCMSQADNLTVGEIASFKSSFRECADRGYTWGENDCCSCLEYAAQAGLHKGPLTFIHNAVQDLAVSPKVLA